MDQAEPPVIANGVVYAYGNGENTRQAYADSGLADFSPLRIKASTHAVLYALDAETGKELYSSGDQITSFNPLRRAFGSQRPRVPRHVRQHAVLLRSSGPVTHEGS